jgi:hypothetical protein
MGYSAASAGLPVIEVATVNQLSQKAQDFTFIPSGTF